MFSAIFHRYFERDTDAFCAGAKEWEEVVNDEFNTFQAAHDGLCIQLVFPAHAASGGNWRL